jgi:deoxyribose-phosphate aldolase
MMHEHIGDRKLYIKASGGIKTLEQAQAMLNAGADRIGASSLFEEKQRDTFDEIR